ncbi:hypothetical protein LTR16_004535, partial [Cryomyces antarcticus]
MPWKKSRTGRRSDKGAQVLRDLGSPMVASDHEHPAPWNPSSYHPPREGLPYRPWRTALNGIKDTTQSTKGKMK